MKILDPKPNSVFTSMPISSTRIPLQSSTIISENKHNSNYMNTCSIFYDKLKGFTVNNELLTVH